jgi:mono/diheme cytochrome c family protein
MKRLLAVLAVLAVVAAGCGDDAGTTLDPGVNTGEAVYNVACIACHEAGGVGIEGLGKPLAGSDFITSRTDQELLEFVVTGRGTNDPENTSGVAMPPRGGRPNMTDAEILSVIAYLRTLQDG